MSLEKPWEKRFDTLVDELARNYDGKLKRPESTRDLPTLAVDPSYFNYPIFYGEYKNMQFIVENNELPGAKYSIYDLGDNVEFLRITLLRQSPVNIEITHEHWLHRLQKKIKIKREFQTGNEAFDKDYFLHADSERDKQLLADSEFQQIVRQLEPLSVLRIYKVGVRLSQMITDAKHLDYLTVDRCIRNLYKIADLLSSIK